MASEMMEALMALCQEKHIDELYLLDRLEQSLAKSYADILHLPFGARVTIDHATGKVYVYELIPKEESYDEETGEYLDFDEKDVTPPDTSRIAAQHAKAEIRAIVRNAARVQIYEEFSQRIGDIITGTVLQTTPDFTIIKIREGVEAELPHFDQRRFPDERNERPAGERYSHNQRLKAIIIDVRDPSAASASVRPSWSLALTPTSSAGSSSSRSPRSTTALSRFALSPASPASAPRSPSRPRTTTSIPWAHALAPRAAAFAPSSPSSVASASTWCPGPTTLRAALPTRSRRHASLA